MNNESMRSLKSSHEEESIIVSIIQSPVLVHQLRVKPYMMSEDVNKHTIESIISLYEKGLDIDIASIANEVFQFGKYKAEDFSKRLVQLVKSVLHSKNIMHHQQIIVEKYKKRMQIKALQKAMDNIYLSNSQSVYDSITGNFDAINKKADVLESKSSRLSDIAVEVVNSLDGSKPNFYNTGYKDLDKLFGWQVGDLNILAARPGIGKTALGVELGIKHAQENGQAVILFSKEMIKEDIAKRIIASEARVQSFKFKDSSKLDTKDWERLMTSVGVLDKAEFHIDDNHYMTPSYIRQKTREFMAINKDKHILVIVDYLQLLNSEHERLPRYEQVTRISNDLKAMAKELKCTVLALAQLNRGNENRQDTRPKNSDIKESGSIEQDASVIMMLHRDLMSEEEKGITEVLITKNRNGSPGTCKLKFIPELSKFVNIG